MCLTIEYFKTILIFASIVLAWFTNLSMGVLKCKPQFYTSKLHNKLACLTAQLLKSSLTLASMIHTIQIKHLTSISWILISLRVLLPSTNILELLTSTPMLAKLHNKLSCLILEHFLVSCCQTHPRATLSIPTLRLTLNSPNIYLKYPRFTTLYILRNISKSVCH
jgi:hypothetical protein